MEIYWAQIHIPYQLRWMNQVWMECPQAVQVVGQQAETNSKKTALGWDHQM
jgi:hypothetical protein